MLSFSRGNLTKGETLRISIAILALATALGLLVSGCGDDGGSGKIDKATFAAQADRICKQISGKMAAEAGAIVRRERTGSINSDKAELAIANEVFIPGLEVELQELRALGTPDGLEQETQAFFRAYQDAIDIAKRRPKDVVVGAAPYEPVEFIGSTKLGVSDCPVAAVRQSGS